MNSELLRKVLAINLSVLRIYFDGWYKFIFRSVFKFLHISINYPFRIYIN